jgi:hypothetical protein
MPSASREARQQVARAREPGPVADGIKNSGVGRELGRSGMDAFASIQTYGIA